MDMLYRPKQWWKTAGKKSKSETEFVKLLQKYAEVYRLRPNLKTYCYREYFQDSNHLVGVH